MTCCIDEDFALWAFGEKWHAYMMCDCDSLDLMHAWNDLHPDYLLKEEGDFLKDMADMKKIWEKSKA